MVYPLNFLLYKEEKDSQGGFFVVTCVVKVFSFVKAFTV